MDQPKKEKLREELKQLITLGTRVHQKFWLEKCGSNQERFYYLDELPDEDWDDEDRQLAQEREEYEKGVERIRENLEDLGEVSTTYQRFYTQGYRVVSELLPERLDDFESEYKPSKNRKIISFQNYTIWDGLRGTQNQSGMTPRWALQRIKNQIDILSSIEQSIGTRLFEIEELLRADMFDSELDSSRHLRARGHLRAAGAVAGVVLEKHLSVVAARHAFSSRKKAPSIADYNEHLKAAGVIDVVQWRKIQGLGDIRNLCDHAKDREPIDEDVDELIRGTDRVLKLVQ